MAVIVRIALLLGTLCTSQVVAYKSSSYYRSEPKYGRPVLAMANSPRCIFNGSPIEDGTTVSSPEPCLNCTCSKGILLCYLRTCTTVVATPGCQVVREKGECCPKLHCKGNNESRFERTSEPSYKYRLRQEDETFFGLIGLDHRPVRSGITTSRVTTRQTSNPAYTLNENWESSKILQQHPEEPPVEQEEDYGSDELSPNKNDSSGYCYSKGYKYTEGMAMLSLTKCEYCYCIRGQQMCVRPKCHLNIDGCVARYQSGYTCCPSHYQCEVGAEGLNDKKYEFTPSSNMDMPLNKVSSCNVEGYDFDVGVAVPSSGHCQTCYCTQMGVVCRRLECSPSVPGCTAVVPEGHCCPTEYKCDQANETQVPVSHSTENYDVTVFSPSESQGVSSHTFQTDITDEINYDDEQQTTDFDETTLDTTLDKQKITVELTDDTDLESISVIPEENIAVLVVTTEKDIDQGTSGTEGETHSFPEIAKLEMTAIHQMNLKHKSKLSTVRVPSGVTDETKYTEDTTKPHIIMLTNLKHKTRPPTTKETTVTTEGIRYYQETTRPHILSLPHLMQKSSTTKLLATQLDDVRHRDSTPYIQPTRKTYPTTETTKQGSDYTDEGKDNYAYDYVELYEDVPVNEQETFAPFADYNEPTYGDRITSTEKIQTTTLNSRYKTKNKTPSILYEARNPITHTVANSKFATEGLNSQRITETRLSQEKLTHSTTPYTESEEFTSRPTKYTIYSTTSEETKRPYTTESVLRQKQKTKPYAQPHHSTSTQLTSSLPQDSVPYTTESVLRQKQKTKPYVQPTHLTSMQHTFSLPRDTVPYTTEPVLRQKQKTKPYVQPNPSTSMQHTSVLPQDSEPSHLINTQTSTKTPQTSAYETTSHPKFDSTYVTETNGPSSYTTHNRIVSNHKQRPHTILPYRSTKPLPQEIAQLLWTITQNAQAFDASTEIYDPTTEQETFESTVPETLKTPPGTPSAQAFAAPKLIEDTTPNISNGTSQYETTNTDMATAEPIPSSNGSSIPPGSPILNYAPEVIFSNHGPTVHRKPQPIKDSDPPMVINNHKIQSTRFRPPVRFRPPTTTSTTSVPQTSFVEISNHRPINTFKRPPPAKFPPYPSYDPDYHQISEAIFKRQPKPRDPHHKNHRIVPDSHPEWREDYDEYYYDFQQGRHPSTKVFTNMQDLQTTGSIDVKTDSGTQTVGTNLQPLSRKNDLSLNPVTIAKRDEHGNGFSGGTTKIQNPDSIVGRSSDDSITGATEITLETTTTPSTATVISSTKPFSKDPAPEDDVKLFRADDNNEKIESSFVNHPNKQYDGQTNILGSSDRTNLVRPAVNPTTSKPSTTPVPPADPSKSEEDSKEINDVCFVDGRYYNSGEIIVKSNPCEMCRCFYGHPLCQVQQCPAPPEPSCILEYLPGYCCPRVTCGIKADSSKSSAEVSAPEPTSQEIRPPIITSDNQWKPLPHGPLVRPVETKQKIDPPGPEYIPEVVTAPPQLISDEGKTKDSNDERAQLNSHDAKDDLKYEDKNSSLTIEPSASSSTSTSSTIQSTSSTTTPMPRVHMTTFFPELPATTTVLPEPSPEPEIETSDESSNPNKTADIHDNSSGVRKVLDETVTLPPSKVSLSPSGGENISTVLPLIPTVSPVTEVPELDVDTVVNFVVGDPSEIGGNLKISGCNVYGKYYRINDKVTVLSKPCSYCICSVDGIACNSTC